MRVQSTLVIAFLVPILAFLVSVRAAPTSNLQSRNNNPFSVSWAGPVYGQQVKRGDQLSLGIFVAQKDTTVQPPYNVEFILKEMVPTGYWWGYDTIPYPLGRFDLSLTEPGFVSIYNVTIPADAYATEAGIDCFYNGNLISYSLAFDVTA